MISIKKNYELVLHIMYTLYSHYGC